MATGSGRAAIFLRLRNRGRKTRPILLPYQSRGSSCWSMECRLIAFITRCRQIQMYTCVTTRFHCILILLNYFSVCTPISPTLLTIVCFWSLQMTRGMRLPFWLLHHLDNDTFPGVCWIDRANGIFQLPWCHRAHKEFSTERSQLFLSWEILKGRIDAQTAISNSMLLSAKATFRCAINV